MTYDIYATPNNAFIPDVEIKSVEDYADNQKRSVAFLWRGTKQWLELSKDNSYNDGNWLITDTEYTPDFQEWLDENLENYDSLESLFGMEFPTTKQFYFVVAVEMNNGKPTTTFLDDERADALFDGADVWNTQSEEWESVGGDNYSLYDNAYQHLKALIK
jgi:hypothetical protein